jgi:hypothetical protein
MKETCSNCGEEVDKEPIVLCDECGGEPSGMTASEAVRILAQRDDLLAMCEAVPDLLEAATEALRVLEDDTRPQATAREMLRAAIAKARGE